MSNNQCLVFPILLDPFSGYKYNKNFGEKHPISAEANDVEQLKDTDTSPHPLGLF